jgi:hypothetical protein
LVIGWFLIWFLLRIIFVGVVFHFFENFS